MIEELLFTNKPATAASGDGGEPPTVVSGSAKEFLTYSKYKPDIIITRRCIKAGRIEIIRKMDSEISTCKDFFNSALTPTNYSTVVTNIKTFIETNVRRNRRIVLVTVS